MAGRARTPLEPGAHVGRALKPKHIIRCYKTSLHGVDAAGGLASRRTTRRLPQGRSMHGVDAAGGLARPRTGALRDFSRRGRAQRRGLGCGLRGCRPAVGRGCGPLCIHPNPRGRADKMPGRQRGGAAYLAYPGCITLRRRPSAGMRRVGQAYARRGGGFQCRIAQSTK